MGHGRWSKGTSTSVIPASEALTSIGGGAITVPPAKETTMFVAFGILVMFGVAMMYMALMKPPSRYPDGKCYLCRQGNAMPGDTCPQCDTEQP